MSLHIFILTLHVLGAGLVLGVSFFCVMLMYRKEWSTEQLARFVYIGKFGKWFSGLQFLTGIILVINEWDEFKESKIFWIKMGLYLFEGIFAGFLIEKKAKSLQTGASQKSYTIGLASQFLLILIIMSLGVFLVEG